MGSETRVWERMSRRRERRPRVRSKVIELRRASSASDVVEVVVVVVVPGAKGTGLGLKKEMMLGRTKRRQRARAPPTKEM